MEQKIPLAQELESLGNSIKILENKYEQYLEPTKWTILRVDGHRFSIFTKKFKNLRDQRLIDAMLFASEKWLAQFNGVVCYVQSDEATMAIPPINENIPGTSLMFKGRVEKLISISSSYFSIKFNFALPSELQGDAHFDCRVFQVEKEKVKDIFRWRQLDAFRNGVSTAVRIEKQDKKFHSLPTKEKLHILKEQNNVYCSDHLLHGTFIKKGCKRFILGSDYTIKTPSLEWLISPAVEF